MEQTQRLEIELPKEIRDLLDKDFDILIKKTKGGEYKVMYYKPKNIKKV